MTAGRPQWDGKDDKEVLAKLQEVWAIGGTNAEGACYADVSESSITRYLQKNPELAEIRKRLMDKPILKARMAVVKGLDNYQNGMDYLKRKRKKEFGDNLDVTSDNEKIEGFTFITNDKK